MKAVLSLYTEPLYKGTHYGSFPTLRHFLYSWVLSTCQASKFFKNVELVADPFGIELLKEGLDLPFTSVVELPPAPSQVRDFLWTYGKIWSYHQQTEPFVHIDSDVYLWKALPNSLLNCDFLCQHVETNVLQIIVYRKGFKAIVRHLNNKPHDWVVTHCCNDDNWNRAFSAGIFGGRPDVVQQYTSKCFEIIEDSHNFSGFAAISNYDTVTKLGMNLILEQFLSSYVIENAPGVKTGTLLNEDEIMTNVKSSQEACKAVGYTHLMDYKAKQDSVNLEKLENRVRRDYPEYFNKIQKVIESNQKLITIKESQ